MTMVKIVSSLSPLRDTEEPGSRNGLANLWASCRTAGVSVPSRVVAHQLSLDADFPEQHRHRIVDMSGRNVSVRVHALQSLNKSLFECVGHPMFRMIQRGRLLQGLVNEKI